MTTSATILDIALDTDASKSRNDSVLHLYHPRPVTWGGLLTSVKDVLIEQLVALNPSHPRPSITMIPMADWLANLEVQGPLILASSETRSPLDDFVESALKLQPFFNGLAVHDLRLRSLVPADLTEEERVHAWDNVESVGEPLLALDKMLKHSKSLREAKPHDAEDVNLWVKYWLDTIGLTPVDKEREIRAAL